MSSHIVKWYGSSSGADFDISEIASPVPSEFLLLACNPSPKIRFATVNQDLDRRAITVP